MKVRTSTCGGDEHHLCGGRLSDGRPCLCFCHSVEPEEETLKRSPKPPAGTRLVQYSTRNMRLDLLDRVRTLAALSGRRKSMEMVLNEALEVGLNTLEPTIIGARVKK